IFTNNGLYSILSFLNSKVITVFIKSISETMNFEVGNIARLPIARDIIENTKIKTLAEENILITKDDWDTFETSWNFTKHPLLKFGKEESLLEKSYSNWESISKERLDSLKVNEEKLKQ